MHFPPYVAKVIDEQSNEEKWLHEFSSFLHASEAPLGQGEEDWALATLKIPIESWNYACWLNTTMFHNNSLIIEFFLRDQGLFLEKHREVNQL